MIAHMVVVVLTDVSMHRWRFEASPMPSVEAEKRLTLKVRKDASHA